MLTKSVCGESISDTRYNVSIIEINVNLPNDFHLYSNKPCKHGTEVGK